MAQLTAILNGVNYEGLVELRSLEVLGTYDHGAVQPNISLSNVHLVNQAAVAVREWIAAGLTGGPGIFEGMPLQIIASDNVNPPIKIFDGYIDFTQGYKEESPVKVNVKLVKLKSLNDLETKLSALTYGYLKDQNAILSSDFRTVRTVTIPLDQATQKLLLAIVEFEMFRELYFLSLKIETDITNFPTAPITLILDAIYAGLIVIQIIKLTKKLIDLLFATPKRNKGITYYTALQKACQFIGYGFETSITELSELVYLPSKPDDTGLTKGIPQPSDFGYRCSEMFEIVKVMCYAKIAVINGTVQLHNENAAYWKSRSSTFTPKDTLQAFETKEYNTDDYKATRIISFLTDPQDEWTVENFTGTNYEIITAPNSKLKNVPYQLNKGLDSIDIPTALGNLNTDGIITSYEPILKYVVGQIDVVLQVMKSPVRLSSLVQWRGNCLKVSAKIWSVPKTLSVNTDGYLKRDQRVQISAKTCWRKWHNTKSFMPTNPYGQKRLYNEIKIPFAFPDFVKLLNIGYFNNATAKVESFIWKFDSDYAIATWSESHVYTKNLYEEFIEP